MKDINNSDAITIKEIYKFIISSKKYYFISMAFGLILSVIYLIAVPIKYESTIVIDLNKVKIPLAIDLFNSEDIIQRVQFSKVQNLIIEKLNINLNSDEVNSVKNALKSIKINNSGSLLYLKVEAKSAEDAEKLANKLADVLISLLSEWGKPQRDAMKEVTKNYSLLVNKTYDYDTLYKLNLIGINKNFFDEKSNYLIPIIIDGPSKSVPINNETHLIVLIKGLLLGLSLAFCSTLLRLLWLREKCS